MGLFSCAQIGTNPEPKQFRLRNVSYFMLKNERGLYATLSSSAIAAAISLSVLQDFLSPAVRSALRSAKLHELPQIANYDLRRVHHCRSSADRLVGAELLGIGHCQLERIHSSLVHFN